MSESWKGNSEEKKYLMDEDEINWSSYMAEPITHLREAFLEAMEDDHVADTPKGAEILLGLLELMLDGAEEYNISVTHPDFRNYKENGVTDLIGCQAFTSICKEVGLSRRATVGYLKKIFTEIGLDNEVELLEMAENVYAK